MKLRTALILVLVTGAILVSAFLVVIVAGRTLQALRRGLTSETARQEFVSQWRRPAGLTPEWLFPESVQGHRLTNAASRVVLPFLPSEMPGAQADYGRPPSSPITIAVIEANELEREAVLQRARTAFEGRPGSTTVVQVNDRLRLSSSQPEETLEVWTLGGWMFFFHSRGVLPAEFIRAYLAEVSGRGANEAVGRR